MSPEADGAEQGDVPARFSLRAERRGGKGGVRGAWDRAGAGGHAAGAGQGSRSQGVAVEDKMEE